METNSPLGLSVGAACLEKSLDQMLKGMFGTPRDFAFLTQIVPAARREGDITHERKGHIFSFSPFISIFKCKTIVEVSRAGFRLFCDNVCLAQVWFCLSICGCLLPCCMLILYAAVLSLLSFHTRSSFTDTGIVRWLVKSKFSSMPISPETLLVLQEGKGLCFCVCELKSGRILYYKSGFFSPHIFMS